MLRPLIAPGVLLAATALLATACSTVPSAQGGDKTPAAATKSAKPSGKSGKPSKKATGTPTLDLGKKKIEQGDHGKRVKALQRRLNDLHYDTGKVDGAYGAGTLTAVWGFQKVNGMKPTGSVGKKTKAALADPESPKVRVPDGPGDRVEVQLKKQILTVYDDGEVELITHISSGSGQHYCSTYTDEYTGEKGTTCGVAVTPTGDYKASRRIMGWRKSKLGQLYNPVYFNGGIAVHGAPSVPLFPASHGCVRIPMHTAGVFPDVVEPNERVYVRN